MYVHGSQPFVTAYANTSVAFQFAFPIKSSWLIARTTWNEENRVLANENLYRLANYEISILTGAFHKSNGSFMEKKV